MQDTIKQRLIRAREIMREKKIDCVVLTPSSDMLYLTGYRGKLMERPTVFVLTQDEEFIVAPGFEMGNIPKTTSDAIMCIPWGETDNPYKVTASQVDTTGITVAICEYAPSFIFYKLMKEFTAKQWVLSDEIMKELRSQKSDDEIGLLRESNRLAGRALIRLLDEGIKGKTEVQVADKLRRYCGEEGLMCNSNGIVASGSNSALPHHVAGDRVIHSGDVVVIDFGGDYKGYQSDMTRTVVVDYIPEKFLEIYNIVLEANRAALKSVKIGKSYESVDKAARDVISGKGYGKYFTHRNGHGIGMDGHEHPYIVNGNSDFIKKGNVFSDEPGIYIEGLFGIRIEDIIAVTDNGADVLTDWPREIKVVH